jgi:hypothetical protein
MLDVLNSFMAPKFNQSPKFFMDNREKWTELCEQASKDKIPRSWRN